MLVFILLLLQAGASSERADKPLQAWQLQKLQAAAAIGRRKVKVRCVYFLFSTYILHDYEHAHLNWQWLPNCKQETDIDV